MKLKHFFYVFAAMLFMASCEYKMIEPIEVEIPDDGLSFAEDILPILESNCKSCHGSVSPIMTSNVYQNLMPYINTEDPESSQILIKLQTGGHSGYVTTQEFGYIKAWIEAGAEDN